MLTAAMQKLTLKSAAISVLVIQFVKPWIGPVAWHFLRALADHVVVKVLGMTNITIGPVTRTLVKLAKAVTDRMHARRMNTKLTAGTEFTTAINDLGGSLHTNLTAGTEFTTAINDLGGSLHMLHSAGDKRTATALQGGEEITAPQPTMEEQCSQFEYGMSTVIQRMLQMGPTSTRVRKPRLTLTRWLTYWCQSVCT